MRHGSLFSGIGGFDLAAEWCGWENVFHCEWNPFGQKVLKHHFPKSISYNDITKTDFSIHRGDIDILSGGFPCQPYSTAGKRLGKEDERHLWPEMLRAIREIQPSWVVGENVRGLTNWNGGLVFDEVQSELEIEGYQVLPFLLPAAAVNAPHRRDRIWFIAYSNVYGLNKRNGNNEINTSKGRINALSNINESIINGNVTDTKSKGLLGMHETGFEDNIYGQNTKLRRGITGHNKEDNFINFPTQSPICGGDDGLPRELDNITFSKWRQESIKAYGNAIVPQVAYQIFKSICLYPQV
jgi:DNA (cytosine-5)-methyltransferase 1